MVTQIQILGTKIDLFEDENINVIDSVLDIKDISKNTNAFTRNFTVPASRINNKLFKHWYDANLNNSFDARKKQDAIILLDGIVFKEGFVQLTKVNVEKGRATSYSINFSGRITGIKKALGELTIKDLDLSAYDHSYDSNTVKIGLVSGLFNGDLVYTPIVKKQYYVQDAGEADNTDKLRNISYVAGSDNGIDWSDMRPSLKLLPIIEAIEVKTGITFSRDFFITEEFSNLFLWLNNSSDTTLKGKSIVTDFDSKDSHSKMDLTTNIATFNIIPDDNIQDEYKGFFEVTPKAGFGSVPYTMKMYQNGEVRWTKHIASGNGNNEDLFVWFSESGDPETIEVYFEVESAEDFEYSAEFENREEGIGGVLRKGKAYSSSNIITSEFGAQNEVPDIKLIDFLKGLFNMFKLVVIPTGDDEYYINTIEGYYAQGGLYDVTKYVDFEKIDINKGTMYNQISFKFQEPATIANILFKKQNDRYFGDEEYIVREVPSDPNSEQIDGDAYELELPFEQVLFEKLSDNADNIASTVVYGRVTDEAGEATTTKPLIHYVANSERGTNTKQIGFLNSDNTSVMINRYNIPMHASSLTSPSYSTTFSADQNVFSNIFMSNNLYSNHYKAYIDSIFNIKKREYKYKAYLPLRIITKLNLNDLIKIKGDYYRINKYSYNVLTGETELDLINFFGDLEIGQTIPRSSGVNTDYESKAINISVYNLEGSTITKVGYDNYDTSWMDFSTTGLPTDVLR